MQRRISLLVVAVLTVSGWVVVASPAEGTPSVVPVPATASAGQARIALDVGGPDELADVVPAATEARLDSSEDSPVFAAAHTVAEEVPGFDVARDSYVSTAPPAAEAGGPLSGFDQRGIRIDQLDARTVARPTEAGCRGAALADASLSTSGLHLTSADGVELLETGPSFVESSIDVYPNGAGRVVMAVARAQLGTVTVLGGAVQIEMGGMIYLSASVTDGDGGVLYSPGHTQTIRVGSGPLQQLVLGATRVIDVDDPDHPGRVVVRANELERSQDSIGASPSAAVSVLTLDIQTGPAGSRSTSTTVELLPLRVQAAVPTTGIDCPPGPPSITSPSYGATTTDAMLNIEGTGVPGSTVELTIDGVERAGLAMVYENGGWLYAPSTPLAPGPHTVVATQIYAGRRSAPTNPVRFTVEEPPVIELAIDRPVVTFGQAVDLTARVMAPDATGTVTFFGRPTTGPGAGAEIELGTSELESGSATLAATLTHLGPHAISARYNGDAQHPEGRSPDRELEVHGYRGQVLITEARYSGPRGLDDSYVELTNTGPAVSLGGFRLFSGSGTDTVIPNDAPVLPTGRSYLIAGRDFSLSGRSKPDLVSELGVEGWVLMASDTDSSDTDAVGPTSGVYEGNGLPFMSGAPANQYAWVRAARAGRPVDTDDNAADFALVSTTGQPVGGVPSMLGLPAPTGTADPHQLNRGMTSYLLDPAVAANVSPNRSYTAGRPGRLLVMRTIENTSDQTITEAQVRITSLSQENGLPRPGGSPSSPARLRLVDPPGGPLSHVSTLGRGRLWVNNLSPTAAGPSGGGLNSTLDLPLPEGGLLPHHWVDVSFSFEVDTPGRFWFGYDVEAIAGS